MIEDAELLRRYAEQHSEAAFAELVRRHVNFVYACALRRVGGDAHLAEDVTQRVFTAVAQRAAVLARCEVLSGWLYTTARNASGQVVRTERRRKQHERDAHLMNELTSGSAADAEWQRLRPVLDDAMDGLGDADRQAVLLRFFEGKSFADVGARLRLTENAARMRVERALDKLHGALARRGVTSTTAALGVALANQAAVAAPAGLAASVTGVALAAPAAGTGGWLVFLMSMNKLQMGIAGALAVAGAAAYGLQAENNAGLRREIGELREQQKAVVALRADNQRLAAVAAEAEVLRNDDAEFKRLARVAEEQKSLQVAQAKVARTQQAQRDAQAEVDRMNKEGNLLVVEFKALAAQAKDAALTAEAKAAAQAASQQKMAEIQAKQKELNAFRERARAAGLLPPAVMQGRYEAGPTLSTGADPAKPSVPGEIGPASPPSGTEWTFRKMEKP